MDSPAESFIHIWRRKIKLVEQSGQKFWESENTKNKYSLQRYSTKEEAQLAEDSNINCHNCTDCIDCTECAYCVNCELCENCLTCVSCDGCAYCVACNNCGYLEHTSNGQWDDKWENDWEDYC